jgi:hypothetical protein
LKEGEGREKDARREEDEGREGDEGREEGRNVPVLQLEHFAYWEVFGLRLREGKEGT